MPDLMTIAIPDIPAARAERVWAHVLETAAREQARSKKRRAIGFSAGATTLAGVLGFALVTPTSSFASWTDVPTAIPVSLTDTRVGLCLDTLSEMRGQFRPIAPRPILGERRGNVAAFLVADGSNVSMCIADDDFSVAGSAEAAPLRGSETISLLGGGVVDPEDLRYVFGRVADEVRGVTVVADDGVRVTASVRDGYFVAWWPTAGAPATVTATDEAGVVLATLTPRDG